MKAGEKMRQRLSAVLGLVLLSVSGCAGPPLPSLPPGATVETPAFETYVTEQNGYTRVRLDHSRPEDAAVLAAFGDADPSDPAGYRNLIALNEALYGGRMIIEVVAQVDTGDGSVQRLLRLTADQSPFRNEEAGRLVTASGTFFLRGHNFSWVSIDDGPLLSGADPRGLVNLVLNFDTETATLNLRTGVEAGSSVRTEIVAHDLPFNIRTGAYGGDVQIAVWDPDSPDILSVGGSLRGTLGGRPSFANDRHELSTSGLYVADGVDAVTGRPLRVSGVFMGVDPNALPDTP